MATNINTGLPASQQTTLNDVALLIRYETLPVAKKFLAAYKLGERSTNRLEKEHGTIFTAVRYNRVPLPNAPLSEGVSSDGSVITTSSVQVQAQQWGGLIVMTDVAVLTYTHRVFEKSRELLAMQLAETLERNSINSLMSGAQVNFAGTATSRATLTAANVIAYRDVLAITNVLNSYGAATWNGPDLNDPDVVTLMESGKTMNFGHYVAVVHPSVHSDLKNDTQVQNKWNYDYNSFYQGSLGMLDNVIFSPSNMIPGIQGMAASPSLTLASTGGSLAWGTGANQIAVQVIGMDKQTGFERVVYQITSQTASSATTTGSVTIQLPSDTTLVYNVYIGTTNVAGQTALPTYLGSTNSGPANGGYSGQAWSIAGGQTITINGLGSFKAPPSAPASGVIVYPTFFVGKDAFGVVPLQDVEINVLDKADKSDPQNQLVMISWKTMYATVILNQGFLLRLESATAFSTLAESGAVLF